MANLERRDPRHQLADLFDWAEGLPSTLTWPPFARVRIEEFTEAGRYVLKAELPGLDPAKDIKVEVAHGMLTIDASRQQEEHDGARTEFRYGSMTRRVMLPDGADETGVTAKYDAGILEVSVPLREKPTESRTIPIEQSS